MRILTLVLMIYSMNCFGEVFYHGVYPRTIELNSTNTTLIRFEKAPIAAACQPGIIEFESVRRDQATIVEIETIQGVPVQETIEEDQVIKTMVRARPLQKKGTVKCSFTLLGGSEVPTTFELTENISRPLIEFKSVQEKQNSSEKYSSLTILQSLATEGKSMSLHDLTKDYETCETGPSSQKSCHNYTFETETGSYEITYVGANASVSAWILKGKLKKDMKFKDLGDFKVRSGCVYFSLTTPQKKELKKGEEFTHRIISSPNLSKKELEAML